MSHRRRTSIATALAALVGILALAGATPAAADEYDSQRAANPLRIVAYILHPIGVILDTLLSRPAHFVVMHEPFKTLFGHTDEDRL